MNKGLSDAAKTVIITGGNSGLGYECAKQLATANPDCLIVIAGRSLERVNQAIKRLNQETGSNRFLAARLDLGSLASVRHFAEEFPQLGLPPLQALVCNAGVQFKDNVQVSEDGHEATFAINYLGHFLLTNLLIEHMADSARILVLSSSSHDDQAKVPLPKPILKDAAILASPVPPAGEEVSTFVKRAYSTSKLCMLMFAYELERKLQAAGKTGITVNTFDPGGMKTGMMREWNPASRLALNLAWPLLRLMPNTSTAKESGRVLAELALSPAYAGQSGDYYSMIGSYRKGGMKKKTSSLSYDEQKAADLWRGSEKLVNQAFSF